NTSGKVKVANSWGTGWTGDHNSDGFYFITYDCLKANEVLAIFHEDRASYSPTVLAVFEMDHNFRGDCDIVFGLGTPASPFMTKTFNDFYANGGDFPFPANRIAVDISEFADYINSYNLYISIYDSSANGDTGTLDYFVVEKYAAYSASAPSPVLTLSTSTSLPLSTLNGNTVSATIQTSGNFGSVPSPAASVAGRTASLFSTRKFTSGEVENLKKKWGVAEPGKNYNKIINGFGTGLKPPSAEQWLSFADNMLTVDRLNSQALKAGYAQSVDLSGSIHFPPIGNQGGQGSCVAFANGYYARTYEEALDNDWDLSSITWSGLWPGQPQSGQEHILSPRFIYNQINDGYDDGSYYIDALDVVAKLGVATWDLCPYDDGDYTGWPSETACRDAAVHRGTGNWFVESSDWQSYYAFEIDSDESIAILRALLSNDIPVVIAVDAYQYDQLDQNDTWVLGSYDASGGTNHANTIVGYSDN
ncbi:MAG: C1 family peptidase, partial [Spirochaetales bacterium]|nr:C1 family peptidase [Spirochaetales bacterium]